ncbi:MAG TPA: hypothetical protein VFA59_07780 [Vicinamibacterales bacterium]|nr:hypothetical protein [Vicinamibacterales bacterium]
MPFHRLAIAGAIFAIGCHTAAPSAPTPAQTIDVLNYVIGDTALWPRVGNHSQNQFVDPAQQEVCWVKYANARTFECWRWDDNFIYHVVDHAIDGNTGESYRFSDGRWMPRHFQNTWSLDLPANTITWFDPSCRVNPARSGQFPYRMSAWIEPARDAGPDLGVRDTLVLEYQPYDLFGKSGDAEFFYFARGAGWYEWDRAAAHDMFNRIGGPARTPAREILCN